MCQKMLHVYNLLVITQNIDPEHWACLREGKRKQTRTQPQTGEQRGPIHCLHRFHKSSLSTVMKGPSLWRDYGHRKCNLKVHQNATLYA